MTANGNNLVVPFIMNIQTPLSVGMAIKIEGTIPGNASMFTVNFGEPVRCCCFWRIAGKDIAFSLSPNFDRQYIIRNSTRKKKWGTEENTGNGRFPLVRGFPFCIEVFIADQELMVAINGAHYCSFRPKTTVNLINSLEIDGDVGLTSVIMKNNTAAYPDPWICKIHEFTESLKILSSHSNENLMKLPLTCILSRTLKPRDVLKVEGRIKMLPYSFFINFQNTELQWPHPNILLHINGRYSYSQKNNKKNAFVFNSWSNGKWGSEKKSAYDTLPMPGSKFVLGITCEVDYFVITLDETVILKFLYRYSLSEAKVLYIRGDLFVHAVTLERI